MKKPGFLKKFTLIDYLIIIIVIGAILFAFMHISSDSQDESQKSSYDSSTLNKIVDNYLSFYREGQIVKTTVDGYDASTGEEKQIHGTIKWMDDDRGANVKILVDSNGKKYLAGLYEDIPNADIYIKKISLETNGDTYKNLTEITASPKNITSLNNLIENLGNKTNYEITTTIVIDHQESTKYQEITNELFNLDKKISIKASNTGIQDQLTLVQASSTEINCANSILGSINGVTSQLNIRIYNCTSQELELIKNNFNVTNIKTI